MKNILHSGQPTIGVAIPIFWSGQFSPSLRGVLDAASKNNINVICFQGSYFNSDFNSSGLAQLEKSGEIIFDLLKHAKIDGLIIHSGSLRTLKQELDLVNRCKNSFKIPMINVGSKLDDILNVLIDNESGMHELLDHLIHDHGYRKFGFIRGPVENIDAEMRFATFRKILDENDIPVDESYITAPHNWSFDSGRNGARELLKSRKKIDVIICASDLLASGAIHELTLQKIKVPDHIGVVGFNNDNFAEICVPALTTVSVQLYKRGWQAVELFNNFFNGQALPSHDITIAASLVLRKSCGCQSLGIQAIDQIPETTVIDNIQLSENSTQESIQRNILKSLKLLNFPQPDEIIIRFIQSFYTQVNDFTKNSFIHQFSILLNETVGDKDAYMQWHLALSILEENLATFVPAVNLQYAKERIMQGRVIMGEIVANEYKMAQIQMIETISAIHSLNYGLIKNSNLDCIINHLAKELPAIGLPSFYLSLYIDSQKPLDLSRLVLAYNNKHLITLPQVGITFKSEDILPESLPVTNNNGSFIIEPLFYGDNQIGYILFEIISLEKSFYSMFTSQLSAALWSALLSTKKEQADATSSRQASSIAATNEQLNKRTKELQNVLMQLQQNHDRMLASEKMSSLGRFTAGITHEMTTPLSTLSSSIDKIKSLLQNTEMLLEKGDSQRRHAFVHELSELVTLANKAVIRSTDFIRSIKAQSRDIKGVELQTFKIIDIVNSVVTFLNHAIRTSQASIEIINSEQCADINGSPTRFTQAVTNLLSNALDAVATRSDGKIKITIIPFDIDRTLIRIEDNGCGIETRNLPNIFDPTFSTKPSGKGSGLGLSIVQEIITVEFCGSINVESTVNKGTVFTLCIKNNLKGSV